MPQRRFLTVMPKSVLGQSASFLLPTCFKPDFDSDAKSVLGQSSFFIRDVSEQISTVMPKSVLRQDGWFLHPKCFKQISAVISKSVLEQSARFFAPEMPKTDFGSYVEICFGAKCYSVAPDMPMSKF